MVSFGPSRPGTGDRASWRHGQDGAGADQMEAWLTPFLAARPPPSSHGPLCPGAVTTTTWPSPFTSLQAAGRGPVDAEHAASRPVRPAIAMTASRTRIDVTSL